MMNIKTNDTVLVLSGKDKGKKGKILRAMPTDNKVVVEGVNVASCHTKPKKQGDQGGIIRREIPIRADKVQLVCPKCGKGTRVAHKVEGDKKSRVCKKCGAEI
ncbi:MAG: 50S ribosomal protein L24 [Oscillospiraceae bacterium]|nr:50S ribosomal protein L24 [Oscillospiraceae bacterium]